MLRLITYLAPSLPHAFFEQVAEHIGRTCGVETSLQSETRFSGPLPGDDEPFTDGRIDIGFVCAPTYRWLRDRVDLLPLPVPLDERAGDRPVYFSDVIVREGDRARELADLRGRAWAYNDRNSRSGWFSMIERVGNPEAFFATLVAAGSHLQSIELLRTGRVDAAAIDSNVLRLSDASGLRILESWGPFPIQPVIASRSLDPQLRDRIAAALLEMRGIERYGFRRFVEPDPALYQT